MIGTALRVKPRLLFFGVAVGVATIAAAILGWRAGASSATAVAPASPAAWALLRIGPPDTAADLAVLTARKPWGGSAAFKDPELEAAQPPPAVQTEPWRLAGIVERGNERLAMILVGSGPAARLEYRVIGETLPDGSVLVQIGVDSATSDGGQSPTAGQRVYRLFKNKQ